MLQLINKCIDIRKEKKTNSSCFVRRVKKYKNTDEDCVDYIYVLQCENTILMREFY